MTSKIFGNLLILAVVFASFAGLSSSATAGEGGFNGGGGGASVCRSGKGNVRKAYLIDTLEGRYRFDYKIPESSEPEIKQLMAAVERIPDEFQRLIVKASLSAVLKAVRFWPKKIGFDAFPDFGMKYGVLKYHDCPIESVGVYEFDASLRVALDVYRSLSKTDRAAFFLHEALYKLARETSGHIDSATSRRAVALLFASNATAVERASVMEDILWKRDVLGMREGLSGRTRFVMKSGGSLTLRLKPLSSDLKMSGGISCSKNGERSIVPLTAANSAFEATIYPDVSCSYVFFYVAPEEPAPLSKIVKVELLDGLGREVLAGEVDLSRPPYPAVYATIAIGFEDLAIPSMPKANRL